MKRGQLIGIAIAGGAGLLAFLLMRSIVSGPSTPTQVAVPVNATEVLVARRDIPLGEVTKAVPSPKGGTVYDAWKKASEKEAVVGSAQDALGGARRAPAAQTKHDTPVGDLGSGSDYTVFLQHLGIPSTDVSSSGSYGVYHSVFDNFAWFKKFGDPDFQYEQQMARVQATDMLIQVSKAGRDARHHTGVKPFVLSVG